MNTFVNKNGNFAILTEWEKEALENGIEKRVLRGRLERGWSVKEAIHTPFDQRRQKKKREKPRHTTEEIIAIARERGESYGMTVARLDGYLGEACR